MTPADPQELLSRRDAIKRGAGVLGLVMANAWLAACVAKVPGATGTLGAGTAAPTGTSATGGAALTNLPTATGSSGTWATGGTKAMLASYPDPFLTQANNRATNCQLACSATIGPCHAESPERKDLSEGLTGLPMRMSFKVVKADGCTPVAGASVEVWHTNVAGIYSAYPKGSMCNPSSEEAAAAHFFRGQQSTDAQGRVDFHTVYPGWYSGRTVHVHFTIGLDGKEYVTSQMVFDDLLTDEVYKAHPDYNSRPSRDTTNANDNVVSATTAPDYTFATMKASDGSLQAWKTIAIRSNLTDSLCAMSGGTGGGGSAPGGMPPGGGGPIGSPPPGGFMGSPPPGFPGASPTP